MLFTRVLEYRYTHGWTAKETYDKIQAAYGGRWFTFPMYLRREREEILRIPGDLGYSLITAMASALKCLPNQIYTTDYKPPHLEYP